MTKRLATVRERVPPGIMPLTEDEASDHLKRTLSAAPNGKSFAATTPSDTASSRLARVEESTSV